MAEKLLKDYTALYARGVWSSITRPPIEANNFEIKPAVIHMVQQNQFGGGPHEDPNHHLELFYEIYGTMKVNGVPPESVRLLLFGFSLKDRAKQWLNSLPVNNISSWDQSGGALMNKSLDEAEEIIENVAQNHHQWASERFSGSFTGNPIKA
ncbi:uncharacterized protein LOC121972523 [Zingiber officinale]|uniref:uncharacterized protein LOC121972523 n=1 Tax=Zingiber officinale TaxID=94328 RepID=UPI001C4D8995|nr:uncharacterized protein LOC121972523 [Zingiber officinale]